MPSPNNAHVLAHGCFADAIRSFYCSGKLVNPHCNRSSQVGLELPGAPIEWDLIGAFLAPLGPAPLQTPGPPGSSCPRLPVCAPSLMARQLNPARTLEAGEPGGVMVSHLKSFGVSAAYRIRLWGTQPTRDAETKSDAGALLAIPQN